MKEKGFCVPPGSHSEEANDAGEGLARMLMYNLCTNGDLNTSLVVNLLGWARCLLSL